MPDSQPTPARARRRRHEQPRHDQPRHDQPRAERAHPDRPRAATGFAALGVDPRLVRILERQGIATPRPIQADTVAAGLAGRDVCGRAPTGSGKTLAFGLPVAHLEPGDGRPVALILAPTRELALQITEVVGPLAAARGLDSWSFIGGTKISKDIRELQAGVDLVIGCPGRLVDLQQRGHLDLSQVRLAVLDEADRMADMGFIPDVTRLLDATACAAGQLLLFSATLDETTRALERRYQRDPVRVDVAAAPTATGRVTHTWHVVARDDRREATEAVLERHRSAIVFTRTKRGADRLARLLHKAGHSAAAIHGDRTQSQRVKALAGFTEGRVKVLVATDIAARGIHVDDVDVVVHYDLPASAEDYTHRSGRTGRAGADGTVVAIVPADLRADADALLRTLPVSPDVQTAAGLPAVAAAAPARTTPDRGSAQRPRGQGQRGGQGGGGQGGQGGGGRGRRR